MLIIASDFKKSQLLVLELEFSFTIAARSSGSIGAFNPSAFGGGNFVIIGFGVVEVEVG